MLYFLTHHSIFWQYKDTKTRVVRLRKGLIDWIGSLWTQLYSLIPCMKPLSSIFNALIWTCCRCLTITAVSPSPQTTTGHMRKKHRAWCSPGIKMNFSRFGGLEHYRQVLCSCSDSIECVTVCSELITVLPWRSRTSHWGMTPTSLGKWWGSV